jgi:hypothetical protein
LVVKICHHRIKVPSFEMRWDNDLIHLEDRDNNIRFIRSI